MSSVKFLNLNKILTKKMKILKYILYSIMILLVIGLAYVMALPTPTCKGKVINHAVTTTYDGYPRYHTIFLKPNGNYIDVKGLNFYVLPIGSEAIIPEY
jgi:hypothetical protein